jgi:hypothetical protein
MKKATLSLLSLPALALLAACADDDIFGSDASTYATREICFSYAASTPGAAASRAADAAADSVWSVSAIDALSGKSLPIFGQILPWTDAEAYATTRGALLSTDNIKDFSVSALMTRTETRSTDYIFKDEKNTRPSSYSESTPWQYASNSIYYWPGSDFTIDFFAVGPAGAPVSYPDADTRNSFSYTTPSSPADQVDLMATSVMNVPGNNNAAVPLTFNHLCAAVEFEVGNADTFDGTIDEIRVTSVANSATYSFADGWSTPTGEASYVVTPTDGKTFDDPQRLILLPQTLASDAKIEVDYTLNGATEKSTFTYSLAGQTWQAGRRYRYSMNISPQMTITFASTMLDAHFVTTTATISVVGITGDWTITGSADSDDREYFVTLQKEEDINNFVKDGYWTENERGEASITGTGATTETYRIFAPENATNATRTYTFTLTSTKTGDTPLATNSELKQYCPIWTTDGYGWEQADDHQSGAYGFTRSKKSLYVIPYNYISRTTNQNVANANTIFNDLREKYDASGYVSEMQSFFYSGFSKRDYFTIDYSNIPISLTGIDSSTDGWTNTQNISTMDIAQDICPFERDIQNTKKTIQGNGGVELFYLVGSEPDDDTKYSKIWDKKVDESDSESGIISYILKKNPYKVNGKLSDDYNSITYYVTITHLRWYLPACEQNNFPEGEPLGEYWSSTSTGDNSSYLLNGTAALRTEVHNVRAIRNRDSN